MADVAQLNASVGTGRHLFDDRLTQDQMARIASLGVRAAKNHQGLTSRLLGFSVTGSGKETAQRADEPLNILHDLSEDRTKNAVAILQLYFSKQALQQAEIYSPGDKERLSQQIAEKEKTLRSSMGLPADAQLDPWKFGIPVDSPEKAAAFVREKLILAHAADSVLVSLAASGKLNAETDNLAAWFRSALMDTPATGRIPEAKELIARFEVQLTEHEKKYGIKLDSKTKKRIVDDLQGLETAARSTTQYGQSNWSLSFSPAGAATGFLGGAQFASYRRRLIGNEKVAAPPSPSPEIRQFDAALATAQFEDSAAILAQAREHKSEIEKRLRNGEGNTQLYFDALQFESYAASQLAAADIRRPAKAEAAAAGARVEELSASETVKRSIDASPHLRQAEAQSAAARQNADQFKTGRAVKLDQTLGAGIGVHGVVPSAGVAIEFKPKTKEEAKVLHLLAELNELEAARFKEALTVRAFEAHAEGIRAQTLKEKTAARNTLEEQFTGMVVDSAEKMAGTQLRHLAGVEAGKLAAWSADDHKAFADSQQRLAALPKEILEKTAEYWGAVEALAAKNPKSDVLNLNSAQVLLPALAVAEGARFAVTGLVNRLRSGRDQNLENYAREQRIGVMLLLKNGKIDRPDSGPAPKQNDMTGLGSISAKEAFSVSAALGIGAAALLKHNPELRSMFAGNVAGSAGAAALSAKLRSQPLLKPALYGALGGELMFAGEQLMADLVNVPGGGFLASGIESLGVSGVKNLVMNRGMFSRFEMPFGPLLFKLEQKNGNYAPSAALMPEGAGSMAFQFAQGAQLDIKSTLQMAAPVFKGDLGLTGYTEGKPVNPDKIYLGISSGGIMTVDKSVRSVYGEAEETDVKVHERTHVFQHNRWGIVGEPITSLLFSRQPGWLSLDRATGELVGLPINMLTDKFGGYRGQMLEQESWAWGEYQAANPDRKNGIGMTALAGAALGLKSDTAGPGNAAAPAKAPSLPEPPAASPLLQLRYPEKDERKE